MRARPLFVCTPVLLALAGCPADDSELDPSTSFGSATSELPTSGFTDTDTGDGDGDTPPGDGDGDTPPGDGDGDTPPGDGDGDTPPGDGDGDPEPPPSVGERPVIYQLVVRHFGNTNQTRATDASLAQNGVGKFADIDANAIAGLAELGATHIWLTGVLRQATLTNYEGYGMPADDPDIVKGRAGSFYAVRDYYDVSPDYALDPTMRIAEFEAVVDRIHDAQLKVLIDYVPNHVARSYASVVHPELDFGANDDQSQFFTPTNNFFYLGGESLSLSKPPGWNPPGFEFDGVFAPEDGGPGNTPKVTGNNQTSASPADTDWYETIKLNWGWDFANQVGDYDPIPDTWTKMDAILAYWQELGVDGFRCDFAHFVPNEGWSWLIDQARARDPEVFFIAEAYADLDGLLAAGFDSVYHDAAYDELKRMYQGNASQQSYSDVMVGLSDQQRPRYAQYLENHDERRIASPIVNSPNPDDSGFGSKEAGYQLGPVAFLYNNAPILFYNGQEVGEPGSGVEGFGQDDGRTSIFDYWSLEQLSKWVNDGAYDGGALTADEAALRSFYADLLALAQDSAALGGGFWGLEYFNNSGMFQDCPDGFYTFARYAPGSGRMLVIVANFAPGADSVGPVRLPGELIDAAGLAGDVEVRTVLDRQGASDALVTNLDASELSGAGFVAEVPDQSALVYLIE